MCYFGNLEREKKVLMWYMLWTTAGTEKKTGEMINAHVDYSLFARCVVLYLRKREIHRGISLFGTKLLFSSYFFIETKWINDFAKWLLWYLWKNVILQTSDFFCPIYEEEDYFLTDMLNTNDIINSSNSDYVRVISRALRRYVDQIKKVIWRKSFAILEMTLYDRKVETALVLDIIENSFCGKKITPIAV